MGGDTEETQREMLLGAILFISHHDITKIREAVRLYTLEAEGSPTELDMLSKVFILNRYVFAIPEKLDDAPVGAGWARPNGSIVSTVWPIAITDSGAKIIDGPHGFFGGSYNALSEFDRFNQIYSHRAK